MKAVCWLLVAIGCGLVTPPVHAQGEPNLPLPPASVYPIRRAAGPIAVDGRLDDAGWEGAVPIGIDWEVAPGDNSPAAAKTTCHVTFDTETLYYGCRASDPRPAEIRAHMIDRDNVQRMVLDDLIGAYIDPFNDQRRAFIFIVNPYGVQADGVRSVGQGGEDYSWDAIWKSAGRITDQGFEVELAIPFRSLRFPQGTDPQTWGFVFIRSWPRTYRHRMMGSPLDRRNNCDLCQGTKISGLEGIAPGRNVEVIPTITAGRTDTRDPFPTGGFRKGDASPRIGGDLRWGVTPNVSLNATVKPDFSQVEADVAQLDVNTRFALFYPEKRPFFLEGADFFSTPVQAVFTRTIADPDGGLKLTGKVGTSTRNAIGVFTARDRLTNLLFPSNQGTGVASLDQATWTTVERFRRDVGHNSHVGVLHTGRFGDGYTNQVGGVDLFHRLGRSTRLGAQYLVSVTEYPDSIARLAGQPEGRFTGGAARVTLDHSTNRWHAGLSYQDMSPEFRADAGFVPRVDLRTAFGYFSKVFYRQKGWFNFIAVGPYGMETVDHRGTTTDREIGVEANYEGPLQSYASVHLLRRDERFLDRRYSFGRASGYLAMRPGGGLALTGEWRIGGAIDYLNARGAREVMVAPAIQSSLGRGLTVDLSSTIQRLSDDAGPIFTARLAQTKLAYHFDPRTMVRAIVQYRDVDREPGRFATGIPIEERSLLGQFLFAYRVNPQTVVFLGYAENGLGSESYDLTRASRTFFAKLGYAWRP